MGLNEIIQVGSKIKEIRKSKGISQKEMAQKLDIPYSTYSNYENNNREPNAETLEKIAKTLGVHHYSFFDNPMKIPEIENSSYAGGLEFIRECINDGIFKYNKSEQKKLIKEINLCIEKGLEIEDKKTYYYNLEVMYSHKIMNDLLLPYLKSDITDIVQLIANFLSLDNQAQDKVIEYEIDLLGNEIYQRDKPPAE